MTALGKRGEDLAADLLCRKHYRILQRNFRTKIGEIDIIAAKGTTLVFCEVKARRNCSYGHPLEAVTPRKQSTIRTVAEMYLAMIECSNNYSEMRFDIVTVLFNTSAFTINHFKNAF